MITDDKPSTLNYATPPAKPAPTRISWLGAASVVLPMSYRLIFGLFDIQPMTYEFSISGFSRRELLWLNLVAYCVPFLLFGLTAAWSLRRCKTPISSKSRLVSIVGLAVNAGLILSYAHAVYGMYYGYL